MIRWRHVRKHASALSQLRDIPGSAKMIPFCDNRLKSVMVFLVSEFF